MCAVETAPCVDSFLQRVKCQSGAIFRDSKGAQFGVKVKGLPHSSTALCIAIFNTELSGDNTPRDAPLLLSSRETSVLW